jgi:hypothetical protein
VQQRSTPQCRPIALVEPQQLCSFVSQLCHTSGVTEQVGRLEVDEVGERTREVVQAVLRRQAPRSRLGVHSLLPHVDLGEVGDQRFVVRGNDLGVEPAALSLLQSLPHQLRAAEVVEDDHLGCHLGDPGRDGDLLAYKVSRRPCAVPAFQVLVERLRDSAA